MTLPAGTRLAQYEILGLLGAGGMGEVYRGLDGKLKREVAIKILPHALASDPDRLVRFEREAQVLASLNHPRIAAIYGLEHVGGARFLVLELVEGVTLQERIEGQRAEGQGQRAGIPVHEALAIARQVADALDAAHERGIVHRDLKPANIKVTPDGVVKVLDFGLAKYQAGGEDESGLTHSPTRTASPSMDGVLLGTAPYMSPEQARGKAVDKRTDIWAFGCVLYELLTGRRAFAGETVTDTLAAIIEREPDWTALPASTPPGVRRLLHRCIEKDVRRRLADAGEARFQIEDALAEPSAARSAHLPVGHHSGNGSNAGWMAAIVAVVATAVATTWFVRRMPVDMPETRLEISTPPTDDPVSLAIAPDGRQVVFAGKFENGSRLWVRAFDVVAARSLVGTDGGAFPFWSPDGRSVGFFADGKLKRIDVETGVVQVLADAPGGRGGAWSADGTILFQPQAGSGPLLRIAASGSEPVAATQGPAQTGHRYPQFLPDGRHFLYFAAGAQAFEGVYVGQLNGSDSRRLLDIDSAAVYAPSGHLLFARQGVLLAQTFDLQRLALTGAPFAVSGGVVASGSLRRSPVGAASGAIVYRTGSAGGERRFVWADRSGRELSKVGAAVPDVLSPAISPDGKLVAVHRNIGGNGDIWLLDIERGVFSRLTSDEGNQYFPVWAPDGSRLVFDSTIKGPGDLVAKSVSGAQSEVSLFESPLAKWPTDWSSDGRFLLFTTRDPKTADDVWVLPMGKEQTPFPIVHTRFYDADARFSADGRWIAYQSDESGRFEVYVQPFMRPGGRLQISTGGGAQARWRRDGKELFYVALDGRLMAVPIQQPPGGDALDPGVPVPLFETHMGAVLPPNSGPQYNVSPDGQRFLMNTLADDVASPITVILNWRAKP